MPATPVFKTRRQEDREFKVILTGKVSSRASLDYRSPVFKRGVNSQMSFRKI